MKWKVVLYPSDEGFAVAAPSLPGCWSQGATREEALENIADAIREYLDAQDEPEEEGAEVVEIEVSPGWPGQLVVPVAERQEAPEAPARGPLAAAPPGQPVVPATRTSVKSKGDDD